MPSGDDSSLEEGPNGRILRPVELKPNRFHSFQGSTQYDQRKKSHSPMLPTALEHPSSTNSPGSTQYFPHVRNAHGVKELSDTKDLDAIFKAPDRPTPSRRLNPTTTQIVSPMSVDDDDDIDEEEEERQEPPANQLIGAAIPIGDRDWSIPSIRLANHVNTFGMDGSIHSYTMSDDEDYTDEGGSSVEYGSYHDDDDDNASLSSKESYDKFRRWRRMSGVLRRAGSQNNHPTMTTSSTADDEEEDVVMMPPPQVTRTLPASTSDLDTDTNHEVPLIGASLLEQRFGEIALDTAGGATKPSTTIFGPPILDITAPSQSMDENAINYKSSRHRRRHKKKSRSHNSAALEWIQDLTHASEGGGQIIEAASSKFLTGTGMTGKQEAKEEDTKALGMAHPLCRSSTIEAGGFAYGVQA
jgi:hypothetical protein